MLSGIFALVLVAVGIELCQHCWGLGRAADVNDVMAGALGPGRADNFRMVGPCAAC